MKTSVLGPVLAVAMSIIGVMADIHNKSETEVIWVIPENGDMNNATRLLPGQSYDSDNHDGFVVAGSTDSYYKTTNYWPGSSYAYDATYYGDGSGGSTAGNYIGGGGWRTQDSYGSSLTGWTSIWRSEW